MNLISHWYFTTCLNMRHQDAANIVAILDALDLPFGANPLAEAAWQPLAEAALKELKLCDVWTRVYAIPQLFALAVTAPSHERRSIIRDLMSNLSHSRDEEDDPATGQSSGDVTDVLIDLALQSGQTARGEAFVVETEAAAKRLLDEATVEAEDIPYLGLPSFIHVTLWLGCVAVALKDIDTLGLLRKACEEESTVSTVELLRRCFAGKRGRHAAISAARVLHELGTDGSGMALAQRLVRLPRCLGKSEPDLASVSAWLVTYDPNKPGDQGAAVLSEFSSRELFRKLPKPKDDCSERLGINHEDMLFLAGIAWDVSLVACASSASPQALTKAIKDCWLGAGPRRVKLERTAKKNFFINGSNWARTAGLCFAAITGSRLATWFDPSSSGRSCVLTLAAHAEDVLNRHHGKWLDKTGHGQQAQPSLSNEVTTIALHTRRLLKDQVHRSAVTPDEWLDLADAEPWILPVLIDWLEDIMLAPQDDENMQRWLKVLPEALNMGGTMNEWPLLARLSAALLGRFLVSPPQVVGGLPPWQDTLRPLNDRKKADSYWRNVLARPAAESQDWLDFDWLATDTDVTASMRAIAAVERFLTPRDVTMQGKSEEWRRVVHEELSRKLTPVDLNRWLRFSLVELVKHPEAEEAGKLALILLIQLGQPAHVDRLVDALLTVDASMPDQEWKVQFAVEGLAARADVERHEEAVRLRPQSPFLRLQNEAAIQSWLSNCASLLALCPDYSKARRNQFVRVRRRQLGLHRSGIIQTELKEKFVDREWKVHDEKHEGCRPALVPASDIKHLYSWTQEQYITDPVSGRHQLFHANYWRKQADAVLALALGDPGQVIAINARGAELSLCQSLVPNLEVKLPGQLMLLGSRGLDGIAQMPAQGQVFPASGRRSKDGEMGFTLAGNLRFPAIATGTRWADFDPDTSRGWRDEFKKEKIENLVMEFDAGNWRPREQGIHDLMATGSEVPFKALLTVAAAGQKWLFSAEPGTLFWLTEEHFAPHSWQLLQEHLEAAQGDLVGLRLTVVAARVGTTSRLALTFDAGDIDDINLRWRNLFEEGAAIRAQKTASGKFVVTVEALGPFPTELVVEWDGPEPRRAETQATGLVVDWDEKCRQTSPWDEKGGRAGTVRLWKADVRKLRAEGDDLAALHSRLVRLTDGASAHLTATKGAPKVGGFILAQTAEGLEVKVNTDSLSLLPLSSGQFILRGTDRPCTLTRVRRRPLGSEVFRFEPGAFEALPPGTHTGVLFEVPDWNADHGTTTFLFMAQAAPVLVYGSVLQKCPRLGAEVIVILSGGSFSVQTYEVDISADAWLETEAVSQVPPEACFLGMFREKGRLFQAWEDRGQPGLLMLLEGPRRSDVFCSGSGSQHWCLTLPWNRCWNNSPAFGRNGSTHVCLQITHAGQEGADAPPMIGPVAGWCESSRNIGGFFVRDVELRRVRLDSGESAIRRYFIGSPLNEVVDAPGEQSERQRTVGKDRDAELLKLKNSRQAVEVVALREGRNQWSARVMELKLQGFGNASASLPVAGAELHHFQEEVKIFATRERALALILQTSKGWEASFKQVPAFSLSEYQRICRVECDVTFDPPALLFIGHAQERGMCQMEFGIGRTLEVPMDHVLVDTRPLSSLNSLLFHGDRITKISFIKRGEFDLFLDLRKIDIEFGSARQVFHQAKNWKFVHTLMLEAGEGEGAKPRVVSVKGFNEGSTRVEREFILTEAALPGEQADEWQKRLLSSQQPMSIYARLNTERFIATEGRVCEFNPVRFIMGPDGLHGGDMILVEAGIMKPTFSRNDVILELLPLSGTSLGVTDRERGPMRLKILRRDFSSRESLLSRFLGRHQDSSDALQGMAFAVNIGQCFEDGDALASMLTLPPRRWKALKGALRAAHGGWLFATVAQLRGGAPAGSRERVVLRVELRPGMFFELTRQQLDGELPRGCDEGTLVRLKLSAQDAATGEPRVAVVVCQFSARRYLKNRPDRPGLMLPIDALTKANGTQRGSSIENFTALDFSAATFSACYWIEASARWNGCLNGEDLAEVMSQPHPRFAWLGLAPGPNNKHAPSPALLPVTPQSPAPGGRLEWDMEGLWFERVGGERLPTHWLQVSFADSTASELWQKAQSQRWFTHDVRTGHWVGEEKSKTHEIEPLSSSKGFIFPIIEGGSARLRYERDELLNYGAPLGSLYNTFGFESLDEEGERAWVTVAGTTRDGAVYEGLWIEWSPGRVIELPVEMLVWRGGDQSLALSHFEWAHWCIGDELHVRFLVGDILAPDRIEILEWRRGPRGFGIGSTAEQSLLPFAGVSDDGSIMLGAGAVTLTLPFAAPENPAAGWMLTRTNQLRPASAEQLHPGDVVLLVMQEENVVVAGCPEFKATPQLKENFKDVVDDHPLGSRLTGTAPNGSRFCNLVTLREIIRAIGGALPVTVEWVDRERKIVVFTFRRQMPLMKPGSVSQGFVLGSTAPYQQYPARACVRLGSGAIYLEPQELIAGLPRAVHENALQLLIDRQLPVWIGKPADDKRYTIGYCEDKAGDLFVEPVGLCHEGDCAGLIVRSCMSQRLYWIPQEHLAWSKLPPAWIEQEWCGRGAAALIQAHLSNQRGEWQMSLLSTSSARRESSTLEPGSLMKVTHAGRVQQAGDEPGYWLVRSSDTKLLMRCDASGDKPLVENENERFDVEIETRKAGRSVQFTCVPLGERILPVEVPLMQAAHWRKVINGEAINTAATEGAGRCAALSLDDLMSPTETTTSNTEPLLRAYELIVRRRGFAVHSVKTVLGWARGAKDKPVHLLDSLYATAVLCRVVSGGEDLIAPVVSDQAVGFRLWEDCQRAACQLLSDLHSRCLRSMHLLTITAHLEAAMQQRDRRFQISCEKWLSLLENPQHEKERQEFAALANQYLMVSDSNQHEFAGALLACLGKTPPSQALPGREPSQRPPSPAEVLLSLARVCSPFVDVPSGRLKGDLAENVFGSLLVFIERAEAWHFEAWLLPPLAPVVS